MLIETREDLEEQRRHEDERNVDARFREFKKYWNRAVSIERDVPDTIHKTITWANTGARMGLLFGGTKEEEMRKIFDALWNLYHQQVLRGEIEKAQSN